MVRVQVGDDLESAVQRDDLSLDVLLQDAAAKNDSVAIKGTQERDIRNQPDSDFLVKHLEHFFARAAFE